MKESQDHSQVSNKTEKDQNVANALTAKNTSSPQSLDNEDKIELERREAYIEPKNREILRNLLLLGDSVEINPKYTSGYGYVYEIPDALDNNELSTVSKDRLLNLARLDILNKSFYDSISACPNCDSIMLTFHNRCPKCKSHNVEKTGLIEHIPCGYINQKDKYKNNHCPKCGELLVEGQYRNMGRWYVCQECEDKFESPEFDLICHNCNKTFTIKDAHIREIPKFSVNLSRKKEIRQNVASLEDIRWLLTQLGFNVEIPGLTIGQKSGMQHHFSLLAKKTIKNQEIVVAIDHAVSESEVSTSPLILYIYKTSEVKVDIPIFIAMPKLNDTARQIAQGHKIILVEGSTEQQDIIECIKHEIEDRITQKTVSEETKVQPQNQPEKEHEKGSFFKKLKGKKN
jgi:predicted RNA-binding Zn-ribbon protein involved in translation (DUF1610 family)